MFSWHGFITLKITLNDNNDNDSNSPFTISIIEEQLHLDKKLVENATIQITRKIVEVNETASLNLFSEDIEIKKVLINTYVSETPAIRHEGNVIIIPVVKEVVVVEKKLLLVEEVYITKHTTTKEHTETVSLKKQEVTVTRIPSLNNTSL